MDTDYGIVAMSTTQLLYRLSCPNILGVVYFKVVSTVPTAPLGSVGMQTAVKLKVSY